MHFEKGRPDSLTLHGYGRLWWRQEGQRTRPAILKGLEGNGNDRKWPPDTPINHPEGRDLLRTKYTAAPERNLLPGPGPLQRSGLDLIRQAPGRTQRAGKAGGRGLGRSSGLPPSAAVRFLSGLVMIKNTVGILENVDFVKVRGLPPTPWGWRGRDGF